MSHTTKPFIRKPETVSLEQAKSAYPYVTISHQPQTDTSLAAQVKRQFANGSPRHITNGLYQLSLSKNRTVMDKPEIDTELAPLGLQPKNIQFVSQTNSDVTVIIKVDRTTIESWKEVA